MLLILYVEFYTVYRGCGRAHISPHASLCAAFGSHPANSGAERFSLSTNASAAPETFTFPPMQLSQPTSMCIMRLCAFLFVYLQPPGKNTIALVELSVVRIIRHGHTLNIRMDIYPCMPISKSVT